MKHVFVTGSERALALLRKVAKEIFICHLPLEGERCLAMLERARSRVMWLSPWACAHAELVEKELGPTSFVVVDDGSNTSLTKRCLRLSEAELASEPERELARLLAFLDAPCTEP